MERKFLDFSLNGSECSMERKFQGSESSLYGLFAPGNESAEEQKGQIPYQLWFMTCIQEEEDRITYRHVPQECLWMESSLH